MADSDPNTPDPNTPAPAPTPAPNPEGVKPATVDLSTTIKLADGQEATVADLVATHQQALELQNQNQVLVEYQAATRVLMNPMASDEDRQQAAVFVWKAEGLTDAQIQEQLAQQQNPENTPVLDPENTPVPQPDPVARAADERSRQIFVELVKDKMTQNIGVQLDTGGLLSDIMIRARARATDEGKPEAAEETAKLLRQKLEEGTKQQLSKMLKEAGGQGLQLEWVPQAVQAAAKDLATLSAAIGDTNPLGRVPETAAELTEILKKEPAQRPDPASTDHTQGQKIRAAQQAMRDEMTQAVVKDVLESQGHEAV